MTLSKRTLKDYQPYIKEIRKWVEKALDYCYFPCNVKYSLDHASYCMEEYKGYVAGYLWRAKEVMYDVLKFNRRISTKAVMEIYRG